MSSSSHRAASRRERLDFGEPRRAAIAALLAAVSGWLLLTGWAIALTLN